jgi:hypothetical protein
MTRVLSGGKPSRSIGRTARQQLGPAQGAADPMAHQRPFGEEDVAAVEADRQGRGTDQRRRHQGVGHHPVGVHQVPAAGGELAAERAAGAHQVERRGQRRCRAHPLVGVQRAAVADHFEAARRVAEDAHLDAFVVAIAVDLGPVRHQHPDAVAAPHQTARQVADEGARAVVSDPRKGLGEEEDRERAGANRRSP